MGLGIGSSGAAYLARQKINAKAVLGLCQLLLVGAIAWAAYALAELLPFWGSGGPSAIRFQLDLIRSFVAVFPAAVLWGASFPFALAAASTEGRDPGDLVGLWILTLRCKCPSSLQTAPSNRSCTCRHFPLGYVL